MVNALIPTEVLSVLQEELPILDSTADWYPAGPPDGRGGITYPTQPVQLPARFVRRTEAFYSGQGEQSAVSSGFIYLPLGTPVGPLDKLLPAGESPRKWPPILEISTRPTLGEPILLRVRTGAT